MKRQFNTQKDHLSGSASRGRSDPNSIIERGPNSGSNNERKNLNKQHNRSRNGYSYRKNHSDNKNRQHIGLNDANRTTKSNMGKTSAKYILQLITFYFNLILRSEN